MNKISRLLGTAALATSLTFGGSALTAGAAFGDSGNNSSYNNERHDRGNDRDRGYDRDRGHDRGDRGRDSDRRHHYKYLYHCYDRHDNEWYSFWSNRYEHKRNCHVHVVWR